MYSTARRIAPTSSPGGSATEESKSSFRAISVRSEEHTSELQSQSNLVCRLLLEKKKSQLILQVIYLHQLTHPHKTFGLYATSTTGSNYSQRLAPTMALRWSLLPHTILALDAPA